MFPVDSFGHWTHYYAPKGLGMLIILTTMNIGLLRSGHACSVLALSFSLNLLGSKTVVPSVFTRPRTVQL
jgi:hypothetical protein